MQAHAHTIKKTLQIIT